jgi:threonine dehydrogenase-like Zn-dependent dehydrogenase
LADACYKRPREAGHFLRREVSPAETTSIANLARRIGRIDVVSEAVGASSLALEVIPYLGTNGVFLFTGVPGRKGPVLIDTLIMRDAVLKNQLILGTVNASRESFAKAKWPQALRSLLPAAGLSSRRPSPGRQILRHQERHRNSGFAIIGV